MDEAKSNGDLYAKYDKRALEVMNQEARAVTMTKRMVNPAIESNRAG